jgi:hypothetical protein
MYIVYMMRPLKSPTALDVYRMTVQAGMETGLSGAQAKRIALVLIAMLTGEHLIRITRVPRAPRVCQVHDADDVVPGRICGRPYPCSEHPARRA